MVNLQEVNIRRASFDQLRPAIGDIDVDRVMSRAGEVGAALTGRTIFNINSTATGGGVAEMMQGLLCYVRGAEIDTRWLVIEGDPEFFAITKRIHNGVHGTAGDGGDLGDREHEHYSSVSEDNAHELLALVNPDDIVVLHDPQTAGLVEALKGVGAIVVWRCHIGGDNSDPLVGRSWSFLRRYLESADAFVFTRAEYVPSWINSERVTIIPPSIDPLSSKNNELTDHQVRGILAHTGLVRARRSDREPTFVRSDGSHGRVNRMADIIQTGPAPDFSVPIVAQVSRWDHLKDMSGVMRGFSSQVKGSGDPHLMLVGPVVTRVADDPEGGKVLTQCIEEWRELPHFDRSRVTLACLPMVDVEENAAIVNAIQRHAKVVVQKSLAEGFGLTVTEAMWKAKPVVASAVGGITDQIDDGTNGVLIKDPGSEEEFGSAVMRVLNDDHLAKDLGENARERVRERYLGTRHLIQYADLILKLVNPPAG